MKFQVTMKAPDALYEAIRQAVLKAPEDDDLRQELIEKCERWFKWGEYLTVEIDTEAMTCQVVELK